MKTKRYIGGALLGGALGGYLGSTAMRHRAKMKAYRNDIDMDSPEYKSMIRKSSIRGGLGGGLIGSGAGIGAVYKYGKLEKKLEDKRKKLEAQRKYEEIRRAQQNNREVLREVIDWNNKIPNYGKTSRYHD